MNATTTKTLAARVAQALTGMGIDAKASSTAKAGGSLRIGQGKTGVEYAVVAQRHLGAATLGAALMQVRHVAQTEVRPTLLIAEYITPPLAEALRVQEQPFADAVGNAWLPGPGTLVFVKGNKPVKRQLQPSAGRSDTPAGLKTLFALLCQPELAAASHRSISAAAGVALGGIPAVLKDLEQQGHLVVLGKQRRLQFTKRMLDAWALAYARRLRTKNLRAIYSTPQFDDWAAWALDPADGLWGGEPAANLLTQYLRPGVLTIYAQKLPPRLMVAQRMRLASPHETDRVLEWRTPFWGQLPVERERPDTVPAVLVYADLLATGDGRCMETASVLYGQYLAATFPQK